MFAFLLSLRKLLTLAGATDVLGAGNEAGISNIEADAADIITEVIATNAAAAATTTTTTTAAADGDATAAGAVAGDVKMLMVLTPMPFFLERLSLSFESFSSPFCRGEVDASFAVVQSRYRPFLPLTSSSLGYRPRDRPA